MLKFFNIAMRMECDKATEGHTISNLFGFGLFRRFLGFALAGVFEFAHTLTNSFHQIRNFLGAEKDNDC